MHPRTVDAQCLALEGGAIVFDRARLAQVDPGWFEPVGERMSPGGGRGAVWRVLTPAGPAVLRHYRRGGLVARFSPDRYLWTGAGRTRSVREFRLLARLREMDLPVPAPLAARWQRRNLSYTADLLTAEIDGARTLAELLPAVVEDAAALEALGRTLARFHRAGVCHADLNAHNVLRDRHGVWWLIDFDRGSLRPPRPGWWRRRLARLQRSLGKLGRLDDAAGRQAWARVCLAHDAALRGLR